jgi:hypothetical protein
MHVIPLYLIKEISRPLCSDVNKAWRVKAKASTHKAKTKAKVTVFWPEAKAKA